MKAPMKKMGGGAMPLKAKKPGTAMPVMPKGKAMPFKKGGMTKGKKGC
jgi:hypothetical protein